MSKQMVFIVMDSCRHDPLVAAGMPGTGSVSRFRAQARLDRPLPAA